jgi:hypothetical protein
MRQSKLAYKATTTAAKLIEPQYSIASAGTAGVMPAVMFGSISPFNLEERDPTLQSSGGRKGLCISAVQNVAVGPSRHFAAAQQTVALGCIADIDWRALGSRRGTPFSRSLSDTHSARLGFHTVDNAWLIYLDYLSALAAALSSSAHEVRPLLADSEYQSLCARVLRTTQILRCVIRGYIRGPERRSVQENLDFQ